MNHERVLIIAAAAVASFGSVWVFSQDAQGAVPGSICVQPVSNKSINYIEMNGVDEALVHQLRRFGFEAELASKSPRACDSTVHTQILNISGGVKKTATLEFRLVSKNDTISVPFVSAEGRGESPDLSLAASTIAAANGFVNKELSTAEREALKAAFMEQARQIVILEAQAAAR